MEGVANSWVICGDVNRLVPIRVQGEPGPGTVKVKVDLDPSRGQFLGSKPGAVKEKVEPDPEARP